MNTNTTVITVRDSQDATRGRHEHDQAMSWIYLSDGTGCKRLQWRPVQRHRNTDIQTYTHTCANTRSSMHTLNHSIKKVEFRARGRDTYTDMDGQTDGQTDMTTYTVKVSIKSELLANVFHEFYSEF